jgi:hypothetical protein
MRLIDAVTTAEVIEKKFNIPLAELVDVFAEIPTIDIKTEVAREIFAETEGLKNIIKLNLNSKELQGLEKPINSMIRDSIDLILLELKNKYTEVNK